MTNFVKPIAATLLLSALASNASALEVYLLRRQSPIGFARLDQGRLISTPFRELSDWQALTAITGRAFHPINVGTYLNNVPEMSLPSTDTDNKIDEIRLTARDQGLDYIVIYGFGADANWASIGGKPLKETGPAPQYWPVEYQLCSTRFQSFKTLLHEQSPPNQNESGDTRDDFPNIPAKTGHERRTGPLRFVIG